MVAALLGMGFTQKQVYAAARHVEIYRATADDLVVWMGRRAETPH
jgi:hypothetical protein